MSFGRYLRQERELRGVSIERISAETRISKGTLSAIEDDAYERLPGRVYMLGYLRGYSECVGLDPNEVLLRYEESVDEREESGETKTVPPPRKPSRVLPTVAVTVLVGGAVLYYLLQ